eukprot:gene15728-20843_t
MLVTQRRPFGNIVGHVKGVENMASLSDWTAQQFDPRLNWGDVEWIKKRWGGKLILKGVMDAEDARLAADSGADALVVSNHGGRQLDGAPSSIEALPAIVEAAGQRIEVWMDGGIRSGQDVLKARALGARGTMIGRAFLYGLGAGGEAGVTRALEIIAKELEITMAFCGRTDIDQAPTPPPRRPEAGLPAGSFRHGARHATQVVGQGSDGMPHLGRLPVALRRHGPHGHRRHVPFGQHGHQAARDDVVVNDVAGLHEDAQTVQRGS